MSELFFLDTILALLFLIVGIIVVVFNSIFI